MLIQVLILYLINLKALFPSTFPRTLTFISSNLGKKRGCEECTANHIKITFNKYLCESNVNLIEHTISNCKKPIIDSGGLTCIECQTDFIPKSESKECFAKSIDTSYTNCDLLDSTPSGNKTADGADIFPCKICNSNFIYSTRLVCDIEKVTNCDEHDLTTGKCLKCMENFLLSFEECVAIPSDELCVKFDSQNNCIQCKQDYELVIIDENDGSSSASSDIKLKSECIVTGFNSRCISGKNRIYYDLNDKNYKEECTECLAGYTLIDQDGTDNGDDFSKCYPVPYKDDNCKEYDIISLMCKICNSGYFIATQNQINICSPIIPITNCTDYLENTNTCIACNSSHFLDSTAQECIANPTGILNCLKYISETECEACADKFFLSSNVCEVVPEDNYITDCIEYSSATKCSTCTTNKVPTTTGLECESITENSCLTWTDGSNCATCPTGKILKDESNKKVCGDFSIDDCALVNTTSQSCDECSPGFFKAGSTTCTAVTTTITNCRVYSSADKCSECDATYMLSSASDACTSMSSLSGIPLSNCSTGHEIAKVEEGQTNHGFCFECNNGFLKVDGKCEACGVSKCRYCDPSDKNTCLVCLSGYFMAEDGKCMSNTGDDEDDDDDDDDTPESVRNLSIVTLSMIFILFFFHN